MTLFNLISPLLQPSAINVLTQLIVNQFFFKSYCITLVFEQPIDFNFNVTFTYIIPKKTPEELKEQLLVVSETGCSDYIVNVRDPTLFMTSFDMVSKSGNIRRSDRKVVFLPRPENKKNESLNLFRMKEANFIANLVMILPKSDEEIISKCEIYELLTHNFEGLDNVIHEPLYLDEWDSCTEKFKINANLFPHDINNLYGKTVKVACFPYKPYVLLELDTALAPQGRDGIEIRIVDEFCRWVNCTVEIVREDKEQWGEVLENGTGIGIIGSVVEDRADMGIAALYSWYEEFLHLDFSAVCIRAGVTCVAPSPRLLASWEMPLMPFSWYMWYAVLISFIAASVGLVIAKRCSSDEVLLIVFGVMISQSQNNAVSTWRIRSVTGWLLVAGLILVSAYGGGLASTFTVPKYEASIDTVQDLVDRKIEWGATHDAWIFSIALATEPLVKQLVSQFRVYPAEELKRRSFTRSMAFSVEKLPAGFVGTFAIADYLTQEALIDMTLMQEDFYFGQCVVMMRKSSVYTEKMSTLILRLQQAGLIDAWETQVALTHLNFKVQQEVKLSSRARRDVAVTKSLDLQNVVGIFILYGFGVTLSLLLFLLEMFTKRIINKYKY